MKQVLITGATGCVGHYVVEALLERGDCRLDLVCRDPGKFLLPLPEDRTRILVSDVRDLATHHAQALAEADAVVHLATAWGDPISYDVNVESTLALFRAVRPDCRILYFSTASILDAENRPMEAADRHGTDYIRSKYLAYKRLDELANRDRVVTLFPTLIFGGSDRHPVSHLSRGLPRLLGAMGLLRHFTLDGSLHYIHARDIARMVSHLLDHPAPAPDMVLGNPPATIEGLLSDLGAHRGHARRGGFDLTPFAGWVAALAGSRMNSWDRYCLKHQHFVYRAINPRALGLAPGLETIGQLLEERGL